MNNIVTAGRFFLQISAELVVLFIVITFVVSLILKYVSEDRARKILSGRRLGFGNVLAAIFGGGAWGSETFSRRFSGE